MIKIHCTITCFRFSAAALLILLAIIIFSSCEKIEPNKIIKIRTDTVYISSLSTCTVSSYLFDLGPESIVQHGHCWSTSREPTIEINRTQLGIRESPGGFFSDLTGLSPNTTYYVRAYATYQEETVYSNELSFVTNRVSFTKQWQKIFGGSQVDYGISIIQSDDQGFVICGLSESDDGDVSGNHGETDAWIVKVSHDGSIIWQKCFGGTGSDRARSLIRTLDGGYAVVGASGSNDGDVSGNHGMDDGWIIKLDNMGSFEWQKCIGGSGSDGLWSVIQLPDSGYIVGGRTNSADGDVYGNHGDYDIWTVKLTKSGDIVRQNCYGGSGQEVNYTSLIKTPSGNYVMAGYTESNDGDVSGYHGGRDGWIIEINQAGELVWQKCWGGSGNDEVFAIVNAYDGGFVFGAFSQSSDGDLTGNRGDLDGWIGKMDQNRTIVWQTWLGGSLYDFIGPVISSQSGYLVVGETLSNDGDFTGNRNDYDPFILRISSDGAIEGLLCFDIGQWDQTWSVTGTNDGSYIILGITSPDTEWTEYDIWIAKIDEDILYE